MSKRYKYCEAQEMIWDCLEGGYWDCEELEDLLNHFEQENAKLREFLQRISEENICDYDRCQSFEQIKYNYMIMKHALFLVRAELKELEV